MIGSEGAEDRRETQEDTRRHKGRGGKGLSRAGGAGGRLVVAVSPSVTVSRIVTRACARAFDHPFNHTLVWMCDRSMALCTTIAWLYTPPQRARAPECDGRGMFGWIDPVGGGGG